jgi:tyrosinase
MALRKNQRYLTAGEKTRFINAVLALKEEYPRYGGGLSTYDLFVKWHDDAMAADLAHMGPAFLAWHREYLRRFELALQRRSAGLPGISDGLPFIDDPPPSLRADTPSLGGAGLGLPYWDWSRDRSPRSWPFKTEFLGGDGTKDPRFPPRQSHGWSVCP